MGNFIRIMYCTKPKFPCPAQRSFHSLPRKTTAAAATKSGVERKCGKMSREKSRWMPFAVVVEKLGWEERQTYTERDFFCSVM